MVQRLWIVLSVVLGFGACEAPSREVYELPPGFRGWVHVDVDVPGCPSLDVRGGVTYFEIGPGGRACTSGVPNRARRQVQYFYRDENRTPLEETARGYGGLIWGGHGPILLEREGKRYLCSFGFFVGTEQEFKAAADDPPSNEKCSPRELDPKPIPR